MKKNVFTKLNFTVSGFCGSKRRRRIVAIFSLLGMLVSGTASAAGFSGDVLQGGALGGAVISGTTGNVTVDGAGASSSSATIGLSGGSAGLIDWSALNVESGQSLNFNGSQFFNVVSGTDASDIAGALNANGNVWIFNPAGISFMEGAQVNVGGLFSAAAA